jgi:glycosyltransferase involved in cell wall biosynthesis
VIRVGYISGEPSPWRAPHLDLIAEHPEIELTVIYAAPTVQRRVWTLELKHDPIILRGPSLPAMRLLHHDYPITPQIWSLLERERFDVLVIGGWALMATQLAIIWARLRNVPYLLVTENHLREPRRRWVRVLKAVFLPFIVRRASGHLVTGALSREHQLHYGADPRTITIFPNTVDIGAVEQRVSELRERAPQIRRSLGVKDSAVVLTQAGRLIPFKSPTDTVEAAGLARQSSLYPLHLVFVGSGPLEHELAARATELELEVTFAGWLTGDALLEVYAATDVFVLFSGRETWGIVVNEAAASGLPLILTDTVGASADLLVHGENGELVHPGDVDGQAAAIARLANDEALRERYGRRSRQLVAPWGYGPSVETFVDAMRRALRASR